MNLHEVAFKAQKSGKTPAFVYIRSSGILPGYVQYFVYDSNVSDIQFRALNYVVSKT